MLILWNIQRLFQIVNSQIHTNVCTKMHCTAMISSLEIGHKSGKSQGILKWKMSGNPE